MNNEYKLVGMHITNINTNKNLSTYILIRTYLPIYIIISVYKANDMILLTNIGLLMFRYV